MADEWYYTNQGQQMGPVGEAILKQMANSRMLQPTDLVWKQGYPQWVAASSVPGLFVQSPSYPTPTPTPGPNPRDSEVYTYRDQPGEAPYDYDDDYYAERRRQRRKRSRTGVPVGLIIGLIAGGVVALVFVVVIILVTVNSSRKSGNLLTGENSYTVELVGDPEGVLHEGFHTKKIRLESGDKLVVDVRSDFQSDVDLYINDPNNNQIAKDVSSSKNCHVNVRIPRTGYYTIVVDNLGPGDNTCHVTYRVD